MVRTDAGVGAHLDSTTGARAVPARSTSLGRGGPENSRVFTPDKPLRTETVRDPAVAVSRCARLKQGRSGWRRLLRCPTTVDEEVGPGDEAGFLRAEVKGQRTDFLGLAPSAQRDFGHELSVRIRILLDGHVHLRGDRAGTDAVDGDAFGRE